MRQSVEEKFDDLTTWAIGRAQEIDCTAEELAAGLEQMISGIRVRLEGVRQMIEEPT